MTAYLMLAAAGGSVVALYSMEWKRMTPTDICFTLLTGFLVAIFAVPYIAGHFGLNMADPQKLCGVTFIGGTFWNSLMPLVLRKLKKASGLEEEAK